MKMEEKFSDDVPKVKVAVQKEEKKEEETLVKVYD